MRKHRCHACGHTWKAYGFSEDCPQCKSSNTNSVSDDDDSGPSLIGFAGFPIFGGGGGGGGFVGGGGHSGGGGASGSW